MNYRAGLRGIGLCLIGWGLTVSGPAQAGGPVVSIAWSALLNGGGDANGQVPFGVALGPDGHPAIVLRSNTTTTVAKYNGSSGSNIWSIDTNTGQLGQPLTIVANGNSDMVVGASLGGSGALSSTVRLYAAANGAPGWTVTYPAGPFPSDGVRGLAIGPANAVAAVSSQSTSTVFQTRLFTASGSQSFSASISGTGNTLGSAVAFDSAGNVIAAGERNNGTDADCRVEKYNSAGVSQWSATLTGNAAGTDRCFSVTVDSANNVLVAGRINNNDGATTSGDAAIVKLNGNTGAEIWRRLIDGGGDGLDQALWIVRASNDDVVVTGYASNTVPNRDVLTARIAGATGNVVWSQLYNGAANLADEGRTLALDSAGNVYVAALVSKSTVGPDFNDHLTVKFSGASGAILWENLYNGPAGRSDSPPGIGSPAIQVPSPDNVFVVIDTTNAANNQDTLLLKYTATSVAAPEFDLEQPAGTALPNNGSRSYGSVNVGSNADLSFTIRNSGDAALTGIAVGKSGTHQADYTVLAPPATSVAAGATTSFTVRFAPAAAGLRSAALEITSNDSDESPYVVNLSGTGVALSADLAISKSNSATSSTAGNSTTYTITASNAGPNAVTAATVADTFPAILGSCNWTCVGSGGGSCTASGSGNINTSNNNLPVGGAVTYTATCQISAGATGTLSNTATVSAAVTDPAPANNSATDTDTLNQSANLAITKSNGTTNSTPGGSTTYTITASNAGPSNAPAVTVADTFPAVLSCSWTCVGANGGTCPSSGSGDIATNSNSLPAGGSVTYTAACSISAAATGTLSNTATVSSAISDPVPGNNSATDTDTLMPSADLSISKSDGSTTATAGTTTTYTIVASNAGPSHVAAATVSDVFPAACQSPTWTCVGAGGGSCTASGGGNISTSNNVLPAGGSVTYTASCPLSAAASGTLSNTASVSSATTDPNSGNNSATDTDNVVVSADLSITKTDGSNTEVPGTPVTYTIVASNAGPSDIGAASVSDTFAASCGSVSWTCAGAGGGSCTGSGSGNISTTNNVLPVGGSVTYTATCTIAASATGTLVNTATVSAAGNDPQPGNNAATDTDTLVPSADLSITKTDGSAQATPGLTTVYTITIGNAGPSAVPAATVTDTFPAFCTTPSWTCTGSGGGSCPASGSGNIGTTTNGLPAGGSVTYTASCPVAVAATGTLSNTATVSSAVADPDNGNNSATDTSALQPLPNLSITDVSQSEGTGGSTLFTFTVSLSAPALTGGVQFDLATQSGTAVAPGDFTALALTGQSIAAGNSSASFQVSVAPDAVDELDETFLVIVSNVTGAQVSDGQGSGTILDDDTAGISVSESSGNTSVTEGGATDSFTVRLNSAPVGTVTVSLTGVQVSAAASTLQFDAGNFSQAQTVTVTAIDDAIDEGNHAGSVSFGVAAADPNYSGQTVPTIAVLISDNDFTPQISAAPALSRQQGSAASVSVVATASDPPDSAGALQAVAVAGGSATGLQIGTVSNNAGSISASIAAGCSAGSGTQRFRVTDAGGLSATADVQVNVLPDVAPTLAYVAQTVSFNGSLVIAPASAPSDNGSVAEVVIASLGTFSGTASVNTAGEVTVANATPVGSHTLRVRATDHCGLSTEVDLLLQVGRVTTFKQITAGVTPSRFGQPVPFSVQLAGLDPTGTVEFFQGSTSLGTAPLTPSASGGSNLKLASLTVSTLPVGNLQIHAQYSGDANNQASTSPMLAHQVLPADTRVVVTPPASSNGIGPVLLNVLVQPLAPGGGVPQGSVQLTSGSAACTVTLLNAAGSCTLTLSAAGLYQVHAAYTSADGHHAAGVGSASLVVYGSGASADLRVRIGNGVRFLAPLQAVVYTVTVDNLGGSPAAGRLQVPLSPDFASASWTCLAAQPAACGASAGSQSIDTEVLVAPGGATVYLLAVPAPAPPDRDITQTASITLTGTATDPDPGNNSAQDVDPMGLLIDGYEDPDPAE